MSDVNLDAYFARIGYDGPRTCNAKTLTAIHRLHPQAIPFENLDVLLGRPIRLDLPSIEQKLVHERRGGYCFEHNTLLAAALRALGFQVETLIARVRWQVPPEVMMPQTHMVLRVTVDGEAWLADGGFGGVGLLEPLRLGASGEQGGSIEPRRLLTIDGQIMQQVRISGSWQDVYLFSPRPVPAIDFEVANWFTSTHPNSRFRQNLIAARVDGVTRLSVFNREFTARRPGEEPERQTIGSAAELLAILRERFGLSFPADTRFGAAGAPWPTE